VIYERMRYPYYLSTYRWNIRELRERAAISESDKSREWKESWYSTKLNRPREK
jgi:hypothetical protein